MDLCQNYLLQQYRLNCNTVAATIQSWGYNLFSAQRFGERNQESRRGWGGYMRGKGPKIIPWVGVRQLTVNILGPDFKTRASDSPMSSLPNNVLHVSPSATFFPLFLLHFLQPLSSSLHPLISPTLCDCGKLMGLSQSSRKPAFLLNWCLGWRMRGTQMFAIPALQR